VYNIIYNRIRKNISIEKTNRISYVFFLDLAPGIKHAASVIGPLFFFDFGNLLDVDPHDTDQISIVGVRKCKFDRFFQSSCFPKKKNVFLNKKNQLKNVF